MKRQCTYLYTGHQDSQAGLGASATLQALGRSADDLVPDAGPVCSLGCLGHSLPLWAV